VILGDTCDPTQISEIAKDCDVISHESTLEDDEQESCIQKGHSTPSMAAKFAKSIGAKKLILTHYSARFEFYTFIYL
jgi:ribonuclease Z